MKKNDLDKLLNRLKEISEIIENDKINIDESLKLFEEGMKLTKHCRIILENAELKVKKIIETNGDLKLEDFEMENNK